MLRSIGVGVLMVGCSSPGTLPPAPTPAPASLAAPVDAAPPTVPVKVPVEQPMPTQPTSVKQVGGGRCEPEPRAGQACVAGDGFCVQSWGERGGHSTALWCREGRWEIEEEVNLPAGDS